MPLFIVYVTVIIAASLAVYVFALRNKAPNWLDDELVMREAQQQKSRETVVAR